MERLELNKLRKILNSIAKDINDENIVLVNVKKRLYRVINEVEFCVTYSKNKEYLALQQFRILMDKIINVIHLRDERFEYLDYLEALEEYEEIKAERKYLSRKKISYKELKDKEKFLKKRIKNIKIDIDDIKNYKYKKFKYMIGYICNDSSRIIHDDNSSYNTEVDKETLKEIEQIVLFFVSNIFISFCKNDDSKEYLRTIHRANKRKLRSNKSIKKKTINQLKKELRGVA